MRYITAATITLGLACAAAAAHAPKSAISHFNQPPAPVTETLVMFHVYPVDGVLLKGKERVRVQLKGISQPHRFSIWLSAPNDPTQMFPLYPDADLTAKHWSFGRLPAGTYRVAASWSANSPAVFWQWGPQDFTLGKSGRFTWSLEP